MRHRNQYFLIGIAILFVAAFLVDLAGTAGDFKIFGHGTVVHEGLDLIGGLSMDLEAKDHSAATDDAMNAALDVITKRVNAFGVSEPQVTRYGSYGIDVEIPGVKNEEQIRSTLGSTGQMFIYGMGTLPHLSQGASFSATYKNITKPCGTSGASTPCIVLYGNELDLSQISAGTDPNSGAPIVYFGTKGAGVSRMQTYTSANVGTGHMAIVLDDKVINDPDIQGAISSQGEITGIDTVADA